jgi:hypothetical protein
MIVSGRSPIPASAAMAKVRNLVGLCSGPTTRVVGRLRWWPELRSPRLSSFFSATFALPKMVSASSTSSVGGCSVIERKIAAGVEFTSPQLRERRAAPQQTWSMDAEGNIVWKDAPADGFRTCWEKHHEGLDSPPLLLP